MWSAGGAADSIGMQALEAVSYTHLDVYKIQMLAGLITDGSQKGATGVPGLSRIPIIGGLFGQQSNGKSRDELVVLITPTVVRNPLEARSLTDEYGRRFRALDPIYNPKKK